MKVKKSLLCVRLFATPWTMGFSRPQYWSGQPFPSPGDLPNPGIEPRSPALRVDSFPAEPQGKPEFVIKAGHQNIHKFGNSLAVQWLRLCTSTAGAAGFIPGQDAKVSYVMWYNKEEWVLPKGGGAKASLLGIGTTTSPQNNHL